MIRAVAWAALTSLLAITVSLIPASTEWLRVAATVSTTASAALCWFKAGRIAEMDESGR